VILCDKEIQQLCEASGLVMPFDPALLNPASIDLRLGTELMVEVSHTAELQRLDISHHTARHPYFMAPREFLLAETLEIFHMPADVCGIFCLKSSRAREGYEHSHAGFADPHWSGSKLTLELKNNLTYHNLPIYPGLAIGQMVFVRLTDRPRLDYAMVGHYNNQPQVMPSWLGHQAA
jgi:dCTP deaminase